MNSKTYSQHSKSAITLLGNLIRAARKEQKLTTTEVAERAGISRNFLQRIEKGDPKSNIGAFFEVATIVGVKLFDADEASLSKHIRQVEDKLTLLPKSIRKKQRKVDDDF
ncbi:helix-turn-helix domain-containing protein [Leucothrix pacifica]|nr:helix-turn-helix domain-containing protein [Leucothrix pacifica]